jgi:hypothetical protein
VTSATSVEATELAIVSPAKSIEASELTVAPAARSSRLRQWRRNPRLRARPPRGALAPGAALVGGPVPEGTGQRRSIWSATLRHLDADHLEE